jgi:hypothetical protein
MVKVVDVIIFIPFLLVTTSLHRHFAMHVGKIGAFGRDCQCCGNQRMNISRKRLLDFRRRMKCDELCHDLTYVPHVSGRLNWTGQSVDVAFTQASSP